MHKDVICTIASVSESIETYRKKVLHSIEVKLLLIQIRLLQIEILVIISRASTKKITQKYIVKEMMREIKMLY
jgi:hypothetical protein